VSAAVISDLGIWVRRWICPAVRPRSTSCRTTPAARYSAVGFEAAVTGLAVAVSAKVSRPGRQRVAAVRFAHPFAVVAAAFDDPRARDASPVPSAWHGLPVFSAWVSEPSDADPPPAR
jgi:hypothetical protein